MQKKASPPGPLSISAEKIAYGEGEVNVNMLAFDKEREIQVSDRLY